MVTEQDGNRVTDIDLHKIILDLISHRNNKQSVNDTILKRYSYILLRYRLILFIYVLERFRIVGKQNLNQNLYAKHTLENPFITGIACTTTSLLTAIEPTRTRRKRFL